MLQTPVERGPKRHHLPICKAKGDITVSIINKVESRSHKNRLIFVNQLIINGKQWVTPRSDNSTWVTHAFHFSKKIIVRKPMKGLYNRDTVYRMKLESGMICRFQAVDDFITSNRRSSGLFYNFTTVRT